MDGKMKVCFLFLFFKENFFRKYINLCKLSFFKINERRKRVCLKILEFEFLF